MEDRATRLLRGGDAWLRDALDRPVFVATGYLVCIAIAEVVATLLAPRLGFLMYGVLLLLLLTHSAWSQHPPTRDLLLALTLAPLIRLLSYSLPFAGWPRVYWYFVVSVPLFAATVLAIRASNLSLRSIGMRPGKIPIQLLLGMTGILFGFLEYRILNVEPLVLRATWRDIVVAALILLVCTGFLEELVFRGLMQRAACQVLGRLGVVYVALLFAILHIGYRSIVDVLFVLGVGLFFGWVVARTGSLLGVTLSHGITNIMLFIVMPLASISTPFVMPPSATTAQSMVYPAAEVRGVDLVVNRKEAPGSVCICASKGVRPDHARLMGAPQTVAAYLIETEGKRLICRESTHLTAPIQYRAVSQVEKGWHTTAGLCTG